MSIATVLSCVAIVISILSPIYSYSKAKKINDINLNSTQLQKVYDEFLMKRIPAARNRIATPYNRIENIRAFQNELQEFTRALSFYRYIDPPFFDSISKQTARTEDFVVEKLSSSRGNLSSNDFKRVDKFIRDIYYILNEKYKNG